MAEPESLGAVGSLVRRYDHDRYLSALFAPAPARPGLFALYAFNIEIAKTREVVREPMLGSIRLQWWREALDEIFAGRPVRRHEVVEPLASAVARHRLPPEPFLRLIEARELDLEEGPPADMAALSRYAEATSGGLACLALRVLGVEGVEPEAVAREVGTAYALVGLIRAIPFHARSKRLFIPQSLIEEFGVNTQELFELRSSEGLSEAVRGLAGEATRHLEAARRQRGAVPRRGLPALLPAAVAELFLGRLRRLDHDVLHPALAQPAAMAAWRMAWGALRGRF